MREEIAQKGIKVILVDLGEEVSDVQAYVKRYQVGFDVFLDIDSTLGEPYRIIGVPTFYFLNEKGIIKEVSHGFPDDYEQFFNN